MECRWSGSRRILYCACVRARERTMCYYRDNKGEVTHCTAHLLPAAICLAVWGGVQVWGTRVSESGGVGKMRLSATQRLATSLHAKKTLAPAITPAAAAACLRRPVPCPAPAGCAACSGSGHRPALPRAPVVFIWVGQRGWWVHRRRVQRRCSEKRRVRCRRCARRWRKFHPPPLLPPPLRPTSKLG